jgi:hypothetical protein
VVSVAQVFNIINLRYEAALCALNTEFRIIPNFVHETLRKGRQSRA